MGTARRGAAGIAILTACLGWGAGQGAWAAPGPDPVRTETVSYADVKLIVLDQGHGPVIVMIPSLGRGAADFDDLASRVAAAGFRVLRPQPRGIGGSTGPMTGITLRDLAADVAHVIASSDAQRAVVLGHDDGNRVARATAAYDPALVSAVILVGAGGKVPPDAEARAALGATFDASLPYDVHLSKVATAFFAPGHDPAVWRDGWYPEAAHMESAAGAATPTSDWWTAGSAPVLVVQGNQDRIAPPANADMLKQDIGARVQVVHIDGAGHALLPEQPDELARIVIGYLRTHH